MGGGPMGAMGRPVQKAKDFKGTLKRLLDYFKPQKLRFISCVYTGYCKYGFFNRWS